jgi:hypothetical protein
VINETVIPVAKGVVSAIASGGLKGVYSPVIRKWNPVAIKVAQHIESVRLVDILARYANALAGPKMSIYTLRQCLSTMEEDATLKGPNNAAMRIPYLNGLQPGEDANERVGQMATAFMYIDRAPDVHAMIEAVDAAVVMFDLDAAQLSEVRAATAALADPD